MAKSRFCKKGDDYINMSAEDMIKFIAHHRGSHAFQLKGMCNRWINNKQTKKKEQNEQSSV